MVLRMLPTKNCGARRMINAQIDATLFRAEYCEMLLAAGDGKDTISLTTELHEFAFTGSSTKSPKYYRIWLQACPVNYTF